MPRFRTTVFAIALIGLLASVASADADERGRSFTLRDVQGPTAFNFDGFAFGAPVASTGRFDADGRGHLENGVRTLVVNGVAGHQTFSCTYTVNADGTGSASCTVVTVDAAPGFPFPVGVAIPETFDFVIAERREQAFFTGTTPGVTVRGTTKTQR